MDTQQKANGTELSESVQALKDDLSRFRTDVLELLKVLANEGRERGATLTSRVREMAEGQANRLRQAGERKIQHVEESIATHPIASVFAALGLGVLMGRFLRK